MTGADLALAASKLLGSRYRLHGRDPASGLDCIGLLGAALALAGRPISLPSGYPLRLRDPAGWLPAPGKLGFREVDGMVQPGDVVMLKLGATQLHLAIAANGGGWIHAHAGLRRTVHTPVLPDGDIIHHWRAAPEL